MPSYLVETYLGRASTDARTAREARARLAAGELTGAEFERSIHVPEDEICFFVFRARSSADAALVAQRARLEPLRIVEVAITQQEERT